MKCTSFKHSLFYLLLMVFFLVSTHIILTCGIDFNKPKIIRTLNQIWRQGPTTALYVCLIQIDRKEETRNN